MKLIASVLTIALFAGCVASGAPASVAPAAAPPSQEGLPAPGVELYHGKHAYDAPPVTESEVKEKFAVVNGTAKLSYRISWASATSAAATIPDGAVIKLKDASGTRHAMSAAGPGLLPGPATGTIDAPPGGVWIAEYEGYAPGVSVTVVVTVA